MRELISALALALTAAANPAWGQITPFDLPEINLHPIVSKSEVLTFAFGPETTRNRLPAGWGIGEVWTSPELAVFPLDSGESLWLLFSRDNNRLLTARLTGDPGVSLYDGNLRAKRRRADQIDFSRPVAPSVIIAAWGERDYSMGSGVDYRIYEMADGSQVTLVWGQCIVASKSAARIARRNPRSCL